MSFQSLLWISALLCTAQVWSMPIKCHLQRSHLETTHNLLQTMAGPFPFQCLDDGFTIRLPTWSLKSNDSKQDVAVIKAVYKTLMNISSLMENDEVPQYWNSEQLEKFENIVYRQTSENKCDLASSAQEDDGYPARDAALTQYFQELAAFLKEKEFSVCAWERVRCELLRILQTILVENSTNIWTTTV